MIFITLGTQKFQFNRLLKEIDNLINENIINTEVYAQVGYSDYKPKKFSYTKFMGHTDFQSKMDQADLVITHGGTGSIITALENDKKVIAVPRLSKFNEHVDDHQKQIIDEFVMKNYLLGCYSIDELGGILLKIRNAHFEKYKSNSKEFIFDLENYLDGLNRK